MRSTRSPQSSRSRLSFRRVSLACLLMAASWVSHSPFGTFWMAFSNWLTRNRTSAAIAFEAEQKEEDEEEDAALKMRPEEIRKMLVREGAQLME